MPRRIRLAITTLAVGVAAAVPVAFAGAASDPKSALRCVGPLDAAGIDAMLADGGSPLAGEGATFVTAAASVGIDPRALVAIGAHESILLAYGPAAAIHNPFGIGPNRRYADDGAAINAAAALLADHYVGEGRLTVAQISGKWAPIGAANDPANLNANWTGGVGALYRRLGGDPDKPITLSAQIGTTCQDATGAAETPPAPVPPSPAPVPAGEADPGAIFWNGLDPSPVGPGMAGGHDPVTGEVATVDRFAFPVIPRQAPVTIADVFAQPARPGARGCYGQPARCAAELSGVGGLTVVAAVGGTLRAASPQEQREGVAFWIATPGRDRIGYSGLSQYGPSIAEGTAVNAGQPVGVAAPTLTVAWERDGQRVNATPMLAATRFGDR